MFSFSIFFLEDLTNSFLPVFVSEDAAVRSMFFIYSFLFYLFLVGAFSF